VLFIVHSEHKVLTYVVLPHTGLAHLQYL